MSSSSSPAQTKRCQYCGAAMVLRVSKSDKNRGKPFWKCLTSYGATSCNGFEWVDVTSAEADQQPDTYDATVLNMLKSIKDLNYHIKMQPIAITLRHVERLKDWDLKFGMVAWINDDISLCNDVRCNTLKKPSLPIHICILQIPIHICSLQIPIQCSLVEVR
ncbi:unnamed protein product [Prunus brigantina]